VGFSSWLKSLVGSQSESRAPTSEESQQLESDHDYFPQPVQIEITDVFDLHTVPPKQVRDVVEEYLLLAKQKGFTVVRIIHGKGIGVQREMVRSILARTPFVFDWTDAPPEAGGLGATIVRFK
jgi:DNA-nicking Smr family endonuclease